MKKYFSFFIIYLLLFSCRGGEPENGELLEQALISGDFSTFLSTDLLKHPGDYSSYYDGSAFFLAFHLERNNRFEEQVLYLSEELNSGTYRLEAAGELYNLLGGRAEWSRLSSILKRSFNPEDRGTPYYELLVESFYKSDRIREIIQLGAVDPSSLYELMAYLPSKGEEAEELLIPFLYRTADYQEIDYLYAYLKEKGMFYSLSDNLKYYILAGSAFFRGDAADLQHYLSLWEMPANIAQDYPSLFYHLRIPAQQAGLSSFWADRFSTHANFGALFTSGRLYAFDKKYAKADELYRQAFALAGNGYERDRSMWYLMNLYKSNLSHLSGLIEEYAPQWSDSHYFCDILEEYISHVAGKGRWDLLERLYPLIERHGDAETLAAFSWNRLLSPEGRNLSEMERASLIDNMIDSPHMSYHSVIGTVLSGENLAFDQSEGKSGSETSVDKLIRGFIDFALAEEALEYSSGLEEQLSDETLRILWQLAMVSDNPLKAIQLSAYLSPHEGFFYSREDLKLRYPRLFSSEIEQYAAEYQFPGEILSGIIRTESAFSHDIVSHAGAVGLSQLMPETAYEQARKLGIVEPDLTDPETNIQIGSSYVRWILDRPWNDNLSQMLIAYNAGGGNLRKWKRIYPRYGDELFAEAIPYKETRNYVKKVVTSSVVYGSLYGTESPEDIVGKIFPDIMSLKLKN